MTFNEILFRFHISQIKNVISYVAHCCACSFEKANNFFTFS